MIVLQLAGSKTTKNVRVYERMHSVRVFSPTFFYPIDKVRTYSVCVLLFYLSFRLAYKSTPCDYYFVSTYIVWALIIVLPRLPWVLENVCERASAQNTTRVGRVQPDEMSVTRKIENVLGWRVYGNCRQQQMDDDIGILFDVHTFSSKTIDGLGFYKNRVRAPEA